MVHVGKKTDSAPPDLAVAEKSPEGKVSVKISRPRASRTGINDASPGKAAISLPLADEEINTKAVQEAKKALAAGKLDTPEAIKRAAEKMLESGL